jgi:hypothetical protein
MDSDFSQPLIQKLHEDLKAFAPEYDAIINVAGTNALGPCSSRINEAEIFDEYDIVKTGEFLSTIMTAHLASNFLSPNGYLALCGTEESFKHNASGEFLESVSKKVVMQTALNMSINRI